MRQVDDSLFDKSPQAFCIIRISPGESATDINFVYSNEVLTYGSAFFAHIYVDLKRDVYSCIYLEESWRNNIPDKGKFSDLSENLIKRMVYPDDHEDFCKVLKKEYISSQFRRKNHGEEKNSYHINFRAMQVGEIKICRMTLLGGVREADREVRDVHILFQNIDVKRSDWEKQRREKAGYACDAVKGKKEVPGASERASGQNELDGFMKADFSGKRILLVEDTEINRKILVKILRTTGAEVESAENGKIAIEYIKKMPAGYYDIIFMDISMPFMNGYDAARAIRKLEGKDRKRIPIIAMTGNIFEEDVIAVKNAGMDEHIAKPIDFKELGWILEKWLGQEPTVK